MSGYIASITAPHQHLNVLKKKSDSFPHVLGNGVQIDRDSGRGDSDHDTAGSYDDKGKTIIN